MHVDVLQAMSLLIQKPANHMTPRGFSVAPNIIDASYSQACTKALSTSEVMSALQLC